MATQLGFNANDPNNPNNRPFDFGMSDTLSTAQSTISDPSLNTLSQPVPPQALSDGQVSEGGFNPPAGGYDPGGYAIPTGPGSGAYEDNLRKQLETQQRLRDEYAPATKKGRLGLGIGTSLKKGTEKVPGKGDGTKDTVPAKLAPGEAVLNKAAAEFMGRGLIKKLNEMGMHKMGMMEPNQKPYKS